jgi:hypothetical protein
MLKPWKFDREAHMGFYDTEAGLDFHFIILKKSKDTLELNGKPFNEEFLSQNGQLAFKLQNCVI